MALTERELARLRSGKSIRGLGPFTLFVPLTAPRAGRYHLVNILALGLRSGERGYSNDHISDLEDLGRKAGTALYMLDLNEKKQARSMQATLLVSD